MGWEIRSAWVFVLVTWLASGMSVCCGWTNDRERLARLERGDGERGKQEEREFMVSTPLFSLLLSLLLFIITYYYECVFVVVSPSPGNTWLAGGTTLGLDRGGVAVVWLDRCGAVCFSQPSISRPLTYMLQVTLCWFKGGCGVRRGVG